MQEIKLIIVMYLFLFTFNVIVSFVWVTLQLCYYYSNDTNDSSAASNTAHLIAIISAVSLGCFIAYVLVQINKQTPEVPNQLLGRQLNYIVQIRANEALH